MNKQMTAADVVGQLRDGMTIGFGGWGPRRKPMAIVREILRSDVKDLTVVAYGGPEVGMLCAAGKVEKAGVRFCHPRCNPAGSLLSQGARGR